MKFLASALMTLAVLPTGSSSAQAPTPTPPSQMQPSVTSQGTSQQALAVKRSRSAALPTAKEELLGELAPNIRPLTHTFGDSAMGYTASSYCLSPDGRRFAAVARTNKNKWLVVVDGKAGPELEGDGRQTPGVSEGSLAFSADSRHISYLGHIATGGWNYVVDGQIGGILPDQVFPCGSSRELRARPAEALVAPGSADNSAQQTEFLMAGPTLSQDSRHAATVTWARNTVRVNLDGSPTTELHVPPGLPIYTPAGQHAEVPRHWIYESAGNIPNPLLSIPGVLGSLPIDFLRSKGVEFAEQLTFSPDGQRLAFVLGHGGHMFEGRGASRRAERQTIVDGQEGYPYNCDALLNLMFSADSRHVAFEVHKAAWGKSFVTLDGIEGKHYDELLGATTGQMRSSLHFQEDHSLTYLAREGRKFYRVTQPLP